MYYQLSIMTYHFASNCVMLLQASTTTTARSCTTIPKNVAISCTRQPIWLATWVLGSCTSGLTNFDCMGSHMLKGIARGRMQWKPSGAWLSSSFQVRTYANATWQGVEADDLCVHSGWGQFWDLSANSTQRSDLPIWMETSQQTSYIIWAGKSVP
jgi:hypothetical protein